MTRPDWLGFEVGQVEQRALRRHLRVPGDVVWPGSGVSNVVADDVTESTRSGVPDGAMDGVTGSTGSGVPNGAMDAVTESTRSGVSDGAMDGVTESCGSSLGVPVDYPFSPVSIIPPYDYTHTFRVKPSDSGQTLLALLSSRFPYRAPTAWIERIQTGLVLLNGVRSGPEALLTANDTISHRNTGVKEPSAPNDIRILSQNDHILVIDKPAPLPVHAGGRYNRNTVISLLEPRYGPLYVVHRLDSVTAGVMLLARNKEAAHVAQQWFASGKVEKVYECIVSGAPAEDGLVSINRGIKRDQGIRFMCADDDSASRAETLFRVLERGQGWSRVECRPVTGRTHQIRLHVREWGYPIWDDPLYGPGESDQGGRGALQTRGISLVSVSLKFLL
jgi:RluA family pseudouridine synthase